MRLLLTVVIGLACMALAAVMLIRQSFIEQTEGSNSMSQDEAIWQEPDPQRTQQLVEEAEQINEMSPSPLPGETVEEEVIAEERDFDKLKEGYSAS